MDWQTVITWVTTLTFLGLFSIWKRSDILNAILKLLFLVLFFANGFSLLEKYGWVVQL
jgi:K+ transporter